MTAPFVGARGLSLKVGGFALRDISFSIGEKDIFVILGPSGAGKTVLLETLAGFHQPEAGRIFIGGRDVSLLPPEARRIAFMFQDYALFPHLTVAQNVEFGRRHAKGGRNGVAVSALLSRLGIDHVADRHPQHLSGGEKQRVALARALAMDPALFIFDEPFAALDAPTRNTLRAELKAFLRETGVPAIYVTHDQVEALALADRMAVMDDGVIAQVGTPAEVFNAPANRLVANFVGVETVLEGRVLGLAEDTLSVAVGEKILQVVSLRTPASDRVLACIRPEDVSLAKGHYANSSIRNQFEARVSSIEAAGPLFKVALDAGFPLVAYVSKQSYLELGLAGGMEVIAGIKATAIHLLDY